MPPPYKMDQKPLSFGADRALTIQGQTQENAKKNQTVMLALVKICRPTSISCLTSLSSASSRSGAGGRKRRRITRKKREQGEKEEKMCQNLYQTFLRNTFQRREGNKS